MICVALIIICYLLTRKFINPVTIFIVIWLSVVLLYNLQLSEFQKLINDQTFITLIVCVTSFAATFLLMYSFLNIIKVINAKRKKLKTGNSKASDDAKIMQLKTLGEDKSNKTKQSRSVVKKINVRQRIEVAQMDSESSISNESDDYDDKYLRDMNRVKARGNKIIDITTHRVADKQIVIQDIKKPMIDREKKVTQNVINEDTPSVKSNLLDSYFSQKHDDSDKLNQLNVLKKKPTITFKLILWLFIIWFFVEIIEVLYSGGVPVLWKIIGSSKGYFDFGIPSVHGLMNAFGLVIITMATYLYEKTRKIDHKRNFWLWGIIGVMLGFYCVILTRQVLISAVLQIVVMKLLFVSGKTWRKVVIWGIVGVIGGVMVFGVLGNFRTGYENFLRVSAIKDEPNEIMAGPLWVYMYLTMTITNINEMVGLGIDDFGINWVLQRRIPSVLDDTVSFTNTRKINYLVVTSYNASGFFSDYYLALGNNGVAAISSLYGLLGGYFWFRLRTKRNAKYMIYYAIYMQFILLSFFADYLVFFADGTQLIIVYLIFKIRESKLFQSKEVIKSKKNKKVKTKHKSEIMKDKTKKDYAGSILLQASPISK